MKTKIRSFLCLCALALCSCHPQSPGTIEKNYSRSVVSGNYTQSFGVALSESEGESFTVLSSLLLLRLTRVALADRNDTAELIYVLYNDSHVSIDTLGSLYEDQK